MITHEENIKIKLGCIDVVKFLILADSPPEVFIGFCNKLYEWVIADNNNPISK